MRFLLRLIICVSAIVGAFASSAVAATSGVTYQGRILKPDGSPLSGQFTQFKLQIRTPDAAGCLMYEEIQSQDLRNSGGVFSLTINDGTGSRTDTTGLTLDRIFANRGTFTLDLSTCSTGPGSYSPGASDGRSLVVLFKDETMATWEPIPPQKINFVPFAFEAKQVAGFTADSLLRVVNGSGDPLTGLAPLSNAQYNALLDLLNGTSAQYTRAGQLNGVALPTMNSGEVLGWNGSAWISQTAVGGANSVTTTMIQNGAVDGTKLDPAISISTSGTIASAITTTRDFKIYAPSPSTFYVGMLADPTLAASYTLTWPLTKGTNGQVLTSDGSGKLTWTSPSSAGITDLTGDVTATGPGSAAATVVSVGGSAAADVHTAELAANAATSANTPNTIVKRDGSGGFAAGAVSATSVTSTGAVSGGSVSSSSTITATGAISGASVAATGAVTAATVTASGAVTQGSSVFKDSGSNTVTVQAPTALANSYVLKWPTDGAATNGQVLTSDTSGNLSWTTMTGAPTGSAGGDLTGSYPNPGVATVGTSTAANIHSAELLANAATDANTPNTIVKRDGSGNFSAGAISAESLSSSSTITATGAISGASVTSTGAVTAGSVSSSGPVTGTNITASGTLTAATVKTDTLQLNNAGSVVNVVNPMGSAYTLTLPANTGTTGQVLTTNGSGVTSWTSPLTSATAFVQGGNTFGVNADLGTNDAYDLNLRTGGTTKMTVTSGGNVGIGTTSPSTKLDVVGKGQFSSPGVGQSTPLILLNGNGANDNGSAILFRGGSSVNLATVGGSFSNISTGDAYLTIKTSDAGTLTEQMRVTSTGKVGIGTTAPATKLEVAGSVRVGDGGETCDASLTGSIRYNGGNLQFCAGSMPWTTLGVSGSGLTALTGDVTASGTGSVAATVASVGGSSAALVHSAELAANAATSANTASTIVKRDGSGNFSAGAISATSVTATGAITQGSAVFKDSGSNTVTVQAPTTVSSSYVLKWPTSAGGSDEVLKTDASGNLSWTSLPTALPPNGAAGGDLTGSYPNPTVATVGTSTAANIHSAELLANAATAANTNNAIVKRDGTGNFTANVGTFNGVALNNAGSIVNLVNPTGAAYTLTLPTGTGTSGQVLTTDGTGLTSWTTVSSGGGDFKKDGSVAMTGAFKASAGADATPSISFAGDPNTGFYNEYSDDSVDMSLGGNHAASFTPYGISFFTPLAIYNGSVSQPEFELKSNSSSGTGVYSPAANSIGFATNSTEKMRITASGNVGIGTTSPTAKLHVSGPIRIEASALPGSPNIGDIAIDSGDGNKMKYYDGAWKTLGTGTGSGDFMKDGSVAMTGALVHTAGTAALPSLTFAGDTDTGLYSAAADTVNVSTGGTKRLSISTSQIKASVPFNAPGIGSAANPSYSFGGSGDWGMYDSNSQNIGFATMGANRLNIDQSGNVNIGGFPTSANGKLDVKGSIVLSGATSGYAGFQPAAAAGSTIWTLPSADGTSGQVLSTDGSGILSWTTPSGAPTGSAGGDLSGSYPNPAVATVGTSSAANVHSAELLANAATAANTNNAIVKRDGTGNFTANVGTFNGVALNNAGSVVNLVNPTGAAYTLTLPTGTGTTGQVLTTNGSGVTSWTTASGGASAIDDLSDAIASASNLYLGTNSGTNTTSGGDNVGVGIDAAEGVTTGSRNVALGRGAGMGISTQSDNIAIGQNTLYSLKAGADANVAIGTSALFNNGGGVGGYNTAIGKDAMTYATGAENTAVGFSALDYTTGNYNIGVGESAGSSMAGNYNIAIGYQAYTNSSSSGVDNVIIGRGVFFNNGGGQSANNNVIIGSQAASSNHVRSAANNVILGASTATDITSAGSNIIIGQGSAGTLKTGSSNILIGTGIDTPAAGTSNYMSIADTLYGNLSTKYVGIGTSSPSQLLTINGAQGAPATSGTTQNGLFRMSNTTGQVVLDAGINQSGSPYTWLQATQKNNLGTYQPLILNGLGGNVGIGTTSPVSIFQVKTPYLTNSMNYSGTQGLKIDMQLPNSLNDVNPYIGLNVSVNDEKQGSGMTRGQLIYAYKSGSSGDLMGSSIEADVDSAATVTNQIGSKIYAWQMGGTVTNAYGQKIEMGSDLAQNTNVYGLHIDTSAHQTTSANNFALYAVGAKNYFSGNVGIGTTSPGYKLDVAGDVNVTGSFKVNGVTLSGGSGDFMKDGSVAMTGAFKAASGSASAPSITFASDPDTGLYAGTADRVTFAAGGSKAFEILGASSAYMTGGRLRATSGTASQPGLGFENDPDTGIFLPNGNQLALSTDGTERMRFDASGNVGIGNTNPSRMLHVTGEVANGLVEFERKNTDTNTSSSAIVMKHTTTGDMVDGFGTGLVYTIRDSANVDNQIAYIAASRWGADNSGLLYFQTYNAGSSDTQMRIFPDGKTMFATSNTNNPVSRLDVRDANQATSAGTGIVGVFSTDTQGADLGGSVTLGGQDGTSSNRAFAQISGRKSNGTSGNYDGYLVLATRPNGSSMTERMRIDAAGNVGIGTTSPTQTLEVNGTVLASAYLYSSDRRLKKDITPLEQSLEKLLTLNTVKFNWITPHNSDEERTQIGLIAQDVQKVFPEAVKEDSQGWLRMNYQALISPIIDGLRELYQKVLGIDGRTKVLEKEVAALKAENAQMKSNNKKLEERLNQIEQALSRQPASTTKNESGSKK